MVRSQFEGAVQLLHHASEAEERGQAFPVDPQLLTEVTKQREVGIGR